MQTTFNGVSQSIGEKINLNILKELVVDVSKDVKAFVPLSTGMRNS